MPAYLSALQAARQAELDEGLVCIKAGVRQREGWAMKERMRDKVRWWCCCWVPAEWFAC